MPSDAAPPWPELLRVLARVATGAAPAAGDHDAVVTLVARGLLARERDDVVLTTLGRLVLEEEP